MKKLSIPSAKELDDVILNRKILICCGTGGVGKTTVSAALALRASLLGKRAVVITIDPAKRLKTSLGIETLGDAPTDLTPILRDILPSDERTASLEKEIGTVSAIVPDTRSTFETFVRSLAPHPGLAETIIRNPIFEVLAKEFSGSNEYMALERLHALYDSNQYDLIVLDTPPSRNTLAFLNAPQLLGRFFEEKLVQWLVLPTNRLIQGGMRKALGILEKLTGSGFMTHLFEFSAALFEVRFNFAANLRKITNLLSSEAVGFVLIAAPAPDTAPEAAHFVESVQEHGFHFDGIILNRTLSHLELPAASAQEAAPFQLLRALQLREQATLRSLREKLFGDRTKDSGPFFAKLPELARDVHSLSDLLQVLLSFESKRHFR